MDARAPERRSIGTWRRSLLLPGLYDEVVTEYLDSQPAALGPGFEVVCAELTKSESTASPVGSVLPSAVDLALVDRQGTMAMAGSPDRCEPASLSW